MNHIYIYDFIYILKATAQVTFFIMYIIGEIDVFCIAYCLSLYTIYYTIYNSIGTVYRMKRWLFCLVSIESIALRLLTSFGRLKLSILRSEHMLLVSLSSL